MLLRRFYLTENVYAPNPRSKANRVLKTYFQPPGVSMHGPNGQPKKSSRRRNGRTRSSTPGGGSDAGGESGSGADSAPTRNPIEAVKRAEIIS